MNRFLSDISNSLLISSCPCLTTDWMAIAPCGTTWPAQWGIRPQFMLCSSITNKLPRSNYGWVSNQLFTSFLQQDGHLLDWVLWDLAWCAVPISCIVIMLWGVQNIQAAIGCQHSINEFATSEIKMRAVYSIYSVILGSFYYEHDMK